ncbi:MAG: glycosyltransferase [Ruminococcus callidus]|nr:glycosyltransferase [Ruminococcus callidus]
MQYILVCQLKKLKIGEKMRLLFVHDHPFKKVGNFLYSTGGLNDEVLCRYTYYCDTLIVVARIFLEKEINNQWSKISDPKTRILGGATFKYDGLEEEIKKCDKMIVRLPSFLGIEAIRINKKYNKLCFIEMVGCAWDALWNHGIKGKIIAPYMLYKCRQIIKDAPYVLYVTNEFLQKRYPTKGKQLGCSDVCLEKINPEILANRIKHIKKNVGKYIIGTTAAVDVKYKGQEFVIKALSILQKREITNFEYQLVGNGSQERLKQIAKKYGVEDKVIFLGGKPHDKVFEWLDSIDIYIQPSLTEGLPRALIEAQSRALPCCGTLVGEIPELLLKECVFDKKGDIPLTIANWLQDFTDEKAIEYATWNFNNSKNYQSDILAAKRDAFYREFIGYVERGKE